MTGGLLSPAAARRPRRVRRILLVLVALVALWAIAGFLRAPGLAADYFAGMESPKHVSGVTTIAFPVIPPFWSVSVEGTVTEATGTRYTSVELLWVEPFTGFVIRFGAG